MRIHVQEYRCDLCQARVSSVRLPLNWIELSLTVCEKEGYRIASKHLCLSCARAVESKLQESRAGLPRTAS